MLPRWSMTDPGGRPLFADCQRSNPSMALKSSKSSHHRGSQSARCHRGRSGTKRTTRQPHRGSQSVRCCHGRSSTKQRLGNPFEVYNRRTAIKVDPAENNDPTTASRFTAVTEDPAQKERLDDPIEFHNRRGAVTDDPAQKQRLDDPIEVHNRRAAVITVDPAHTKMTRRPYRGSQSARCCHGRSGTKTTTRRPRRGSQSALYRHSRSGTKQ